jgi:replicative DNA helicase
MAAQRELDKLPIWINDREKPSIGEIRAQARVFARRKKIGLIMVDHVQIIRGEGRQENRTQELTQITGALKGMAKETGCPVIALSQLSREVEKREDKRPQLSDLRESGSIEQDADVILFLYRAEYYLERETPKADARMDVKNAHDLALQASRHRVQAIVAKRRRGPSGYADLFCDLSICRFGNLAEMPQEPVGSLV